MKFPITREGYESLKKEHEFLLNTKRPAILKAIEEAREHGDISENAEYDAAKEEFQFLQQRVAEIEEKIMNSEIVDGRQGDGDTVAFGCCIVLKNLDTDEDVIYTLVGPYESDIQKGRISMSSPLGRALLGKGVGDEVAFKAPGGNRIYEIVRIE
ncbi:MAG TPA: transcription elongation factor GreA [Syntrophorhabdus sp.]|jgi:transcription elongation factor GreA|nr:transcription elongation factor GreA [Syntrophorhabdus sp.]MDI9558409.1 transcription elongation factor GreA [Pseudomonadota bacterium]OPX98651.1 MAG: Transcription elongation factor GreA [Syntrophorhabdus sp. PtaB.Bin027]OQB77162.1 MAG: Transcription elongation factor GreA [Deltaproteobacteria bacterium ADurb.Bin135]MBP8746090.1 transcription elongation factor GreA [Syntrophorhabdus sp.]